MSAIRRQRRSVCATSSARRSAPISSCRPTNGESNARATPGASARTLRRRYASSGSALPRRTTGPSGSTSTASRTSRSVASPSTASPGSASSWSRLPTFTAEPVTKVPPADAWPETASPVLIPIRSRKRTPRSRSSASSRAWTAVSMSSAARIARRASSSCATGTPKTAITSSPANFSTVPPCRSIALRISSKNVDIRSRSASGSRLSPSSVEPLTSAKRTVTVRRPDRTVGASATGRPSWQAASSSGSCLRIARSSRCSASPGSSPCTSSSCLRASRYTASASTCRPPR